MMLDCRMLSQGPSTEYPPKCRMPSMPSQIASTCAGSDSSAALNFSLLPRSAGALHDRCRPSGHEGGGNFRSRHALPPHFPPLGFGGIRLPAFSFLWVDTGASAACV